MSTATEHVDEHAAHGDAHDEHVHEHKSMGYYIGVAGALAVMTAIETSTYWVDFGAAFLPVLLGLMVIKFFTVVLLFMHLKTDNKLFGYLFYSGLGLAVFVYMLALFTFKFFSGS